MTAAAPKVEVGFDLTESSIGPFLRLNDPVAGKLNSPDYRLGGTIFYDITDRVRDITISRGKPRRFAAFPAAIANVSFNNHDRAFDPLYVNSPFYGNIIPRREIRISIGGELAFSGWVSDWNLTYTPDGNSLADATSLDATTILAQQTLGASTPSVEATGSRIAATLDALGWSASLRSLDDGTVDCGAQAISDGTGGLSYLQTVSATEGGLLFVAKNGHVTFRNRKQFPTSATLVVFDQGDNIPYSSIGIVYGSELLFNQVAIANVDGATVVTTDQASIGTYGAREYSQTDLLGATDQQSIDLSVHYADIYSQPEYRVESLNIKINDLSSEKQAELFGLEIGSVCKVDFTPNGIGDAIEKFVQVIKIEHAKTPQFHDMTLSFQEVKYLGLILDDAVFGKLDTANLG